jgi:hypothetical protein
MRAKVHETVHHEIAHHFGISDARLVELAREHDAGGPAPAADDGRLADDRPAR